MSKPKKQTGRYIVEINDWGCGTLIKDTLTGKEIDAPAEETVNLCIMEMNQLAAEVERLRKAGTEMGKHLPDTDEANRAYIDFEAGGRS